MLLGRRPLSVIRYRLFSDGQKRTYETDRANGVGRIIGSKETADRSHSA